MISLNPLGSFAFVWMLHVLSLINRRPLLILKNYEPSNDGSISQAVHLWPLALGAAINTNTTRDLVELEPELLGSMKDTTDNPHGGVVVGCWNPTFDGRACVRVDKFVDCSVQYRQRCSGTTDACSHVAASSSGMH